LFVGGFRWSKETRFLELVAKVVKRNPVSGVGGFRWSKETRFLGLVAEVDVNYPVSGVLVSGVLPWGGEKPGQETGFLCRGEWPFAPTWLVAKVV